MAEGEIRPTKKGVFLPIDSWKKLTRLVPKINEVIENLEE